VTDGPTPAGIEVVERRTELLDAIADRPRDQRDLREAVGVSRSTVYKTLRELCEAGLVVETDGIYRLTQYGRLLRRSHDSYQGRLARLSRAEPVLSALPADLLVPLEFVTRARVHTAERHAPERPFEALESLTGRTSSYRCLSPIAVSRYMDRIHGQVERGLDAELLVERAAAGHLRRYDRFEELRAETGFCLLRTDERVPYGLLVDDEHEVAALFAYGPEGSLRGVLASEARTAYRWADQRYRELAADAEPA
jgi:predicted transcriptional regulator